MKTQGYLRIYSKIIFVILLSCAPKVEAQRLVAPGGSPQQVTKLVLEDARMNVLSASGLFAEISTAVIRKAMDFKDDRDLFTVELSNGETSAGRLTFVVREVLSEGCNKITIADPAERRTRNLIFQVTEPSAACGRDSKAKVVIHSSFGMTGMIDGTIEMEGKFNPSF